MIRRNRRTEVAGTRVTPGPTRAERVRAVAMARGSTPKRALVIGFLAATMVVSMSPLAGAHGGDADKVHACLVSSSGTLRIVGAGESCRNGETPLDWSVGSGIGTGITGADIQDESIGSDDLGEASVGTSEITNDSVAAVDLADGAVVGRAIAGDASLVNIKLGTIAGEGADASAGVVGDVALGTITGQGDNDDFDDGTVTGNLALNTVGRRNLVDGAIDATKLSQAFLGELVTKAELTAHLVAMESNEPASTAPREPNDGDGFLHWNHLEGVPDAVLEGSGAVVALRNDLATRDGTPNQDGDLVSFDQLKDLTAASGDGRITGDFIKDATITASDLGAGSVESVEIRDGTITNADLAGSDTGAIVVGAVTSAKIADDAVESRDIRNDTITATDLAQDAVHNEELAEGSVRGAEVQDGSLTTEELTANASVGISGGVATLGTGQPDVVVSTSLTVPTSPTPGPAVNHRVLLTGQATLDCTGCTVPVAVTYSLAKDGVPISPLMTATVDAADGDIVLPVSFVTDAQQGENTFQVLVTAIFAGGTAEVKSATLNAVDLGRA